MVVDYRPLALNALPAAPEPFTGYSTISDPKGDIDFTFIDISNVIVVPKGDFTFSFIDITNVGVRVEDGEVTAEIQLAGLPEQLTFNQAEKHTIEYSWTVYFDVDGNPDTGADLKKERKGADYELVIYYDSQGGVATVDTLLNRYKKAVRKAKAGGSWVPEAGALATSATMNYTTNTLTIQGLVPGLNANSRWWAEAYWYPESSGYIVNDRAPDTYYDTLQ